MMTREEVKKRIDAYQEIVNERTRAGHYKEGPPPSPRKSETPDSVAPNEGNAVEGEKMHRGDWMQTASGLQVWVLEPAPATIVVEDIAHHLAQLSRYCGAAPFPYSVAQHSILVSERAEALALQTCASNPPGPETDEELGRRLDVDRAYVRSIALQGLLHDAAEAYLLDIHRPLKQSLSVSDLGISFDDLEDVWLGTIFARFRLPPLPLPAEVKRADSELWSTEARDFFPNPPADWHLKYPPLDVHLDRWTFEEAKEGFLRRFFELGGKP